MTEGPFSFQNTRWSVVQRAVGTDDAAAMAALAILCEAYWYPIYAYIRRTGRSPHDTEDLTQGFFAWLLSRGTFAKADATKGKLRNFLLTCVRRFLGDEHDRAMAQKRGAAVLTSFDAEDAEQRYAAEPVDDVSPDRLYQRRWALTVLAQAMEVLAAEYEDARRFKLLRPFLGFAPEPTAKYEEIAAELGRTVSTIKSDVLRLRARWKDLIFEQLERTLPDASREEIKAEMGELIGYV